MKKQTRVLVLSIMLCLSLGLVSHAASRVKEDPTTIIRQFT